MGKIKQFTKPEQNTLKFEQYVYFMHCEWNIYKETTKICWNPLVRLYFTSLKQPGPYRYTFIWILYSKKNITFFPQTNDYKIAYLVT